MAGALTVAAAVLSFTSLVLVAIAMATNRWVAFNPDRIAETPENPFVVGTQFEALQLEYDLDHFGLWVGCHKEKVRHSLHAFHLPYTPSTQT